MSRHTILSIALSSKPPHLPPHSQAHLLLINKYTAKMSLTALQGASLIASHALATKMLLSFTLRTYQFLEPDPKRREAVETSSYVQNFQKAQANESEYAALLVALLLFFSTQADVDVSAATTMATTSQILYVWTRTAVGYPKGPTIVTAVVRYGGLGLLVSALVKLAFESQ